MTERHPSIELIRGLHNVPPQDAGCALTMGKFDGVHLGHQALLAKTRAAADALGLPATVLSFDPSPREFFKPDAPVRRISTLRDKLGALESFGVDRLVLARFSHALADTSPEDFVEQILVARLGVKAIIVGDDLRFGRNRAGDYNYLQQCGQRMGFDVYSVGTVDVGGERCSSSAVRDSLADCDFDRAQKLLGRPYAVSGRIRKGLQLGRKLGMPTANIAIAKRLAIPLGVYAVTARLGEKTWQGVASLGIRPTLGLTQCLLETYLFDVNIDLYGQLLEVEFHHFLRGEIRFDDMDALREQMHRDAADARQLLNS
tara:strand:+ start:2438 stop:3382 length:945 start_codon:yes stop_codon:yes gene_type:complete